MRHWHAMTGRECLIDLDVIARQLSRAIGTDGGMCWADIPQLSTQGRRCPAVRQQYWQRLRPTGTDLRPSANEGRDISKFGRICECSALSPVAGACRWSLPLPSPLLSAEGSAWTAPGLDGS